MILGDSFPRSAYVVYDLVNNQAAMAQTQAQHHGLESGGIRQLRGYGAPPRNAGAEQGSRELGQMMR